MFLKLYFLIAAFFLTEVHASNKSDDENNFVLENEKIKGRGIEQIQKKIDQLNLQKKRN